MRIAIFGSREFPDRELVRATVFSIAEKTPSAVIVSGGARGVDRWAVEAAREAGLQVEEYLADWDTHGKAAGFMRNTTIVESSDVGIGFWDGISRGTMDTKGKFEKAGKRVTIVTRNRPT